MKRKLVVAAATLSLFPIFLITLLPASVAIGWFPMCGIGFSGVSGTIWTGSIAQISSADISLGRLQWSNGSLAGLIGRPAWDIELNRPTSQIDTFLDPKPKK